MRGNVLKIIVFVAILVAIDVALMAFGDYLRSNARGGIYLMADRGQLHIACTGAGLWIVEGVTSL